MFTQFGNAKYTFAFATDSEDTSTAAAAIETETGIAPLELTISGEAEFIAEAEGADGTVEGLAVAEKKYTFTLSGFLTNKTTFDSEGNSFTHDGRFYIVTGNQLGKQTKEFQKAQVTGVCYANITSEVSST